MIGTDELTLQRLALEVAVDQLTRPATEPVGDGRRAGVPSLLDQLDDARTSRSALGVGAPAHSKAPVRVEVLDLLVEIEGTLVRYARPTLGERLRAWSAEQHSATSPEVLSEAVELTERWVACARHLLDPRPSWRMHGVSCPVCGEAVERRTNSVGDEVLDGALEVLPHDGLRCVLCGSRWTPTELEAMAEHIARQTEVETLAHDEQ